MLAYGFITLFSTDSHQSWYYKYEIDGSTGFNIYSIATPDRASNQRYSKQTISDFLSEPLVAQILQTPDQVKGKYQASLVLSGLPASPADAFYNIKLSYDGNAFTLGVKASEYFGFSPQESAYFQNLDLTFSQELNTDVLTVKGGVEAVVFGQNIFLEAELENSAQLVFKYNSNNNSNLPQLPIEPWGNLAVTTFKIKPPKTLPNSLQVLYLFGESSGEWVYDCSLINTVNAPAIDLKIQTDSATINRSVGCVALKDALIASENNNNNDSNYGSSISSNVSDNFWQNSYYSQWLPSANRNNRNNRSTRGSSAAKLINAFEQTNEITIAAWLKPSRKQQGGPARIVTLSENLNRRYFTLGHGEGRSSQSQSKSKYVVRLRSSRNDQNGTRQELATKPGVANTEQLTYLVYTFSSQTSSNNSNNAKVYLNGQLNNSRRIDSNYNAPHPWLNQPGVKLALGNEVNTSNRSVSWEGELYEVAIYNSALTAEEIYQRYYPTIEIAGNLQLTNMPKPLNEPLMAQLSLETASQEKLKLQVYTDVSREVTPQFKFEKISLSWEAYPSETPTWYLDKGEIDSTLWENAIPLTANKDRNNQGRFILISPELNLEFGLPSINTLECVNLCLQVDNTGEGWQIDSTTTMSEIELPKLQDGRPFDWEVDFKLLFPPHPYKHLFLPLGIENGKVVLSGNWLGENLALDGDWRNNHFVLQGERNLQLPFQITLGQIYASGTSDRILDRVEIVSLMKIKLSLELTKSGFLNRVSSSFNWRENTFTIPEFNLFEPPLSQNQILEAVLDKFVSEAELIFTEQFHEEEEYYFATVEGQPVLYFGNSSNFSLNQITTTLPPLFLTGIENSFIFEQFSLIQNTDQSCTLTITLPETVNIPALETLKSNYVAFLNSLETQAQLIPGVLTLVRNRIAQQIPILVEDTLAYYYDLDRNQGAVDLQAGMRLRVDYQNYQFVHPAQSSANQGFVGSGTSYYYLNSYRENDLNRGLIINFDAFLSQIQPYVKSEFDNYLGVSSSLDTFKVGYQHPYLRLVYPSQTQSSQGSLDPGQVATIMGSASLAALKGENNSFDVASFYFRGRATVIPEIALIVQGETIFVPVGTTLKQLMEQTVSVPSPFSGQSLLSSIGKLRFSRLVHEGISNQPYYRLVNLLQAEEEGILVLDLPLVKGDRISLVL